MKNCEESSLRLIGHHRRACYANLPTLMICSVSASFPIALSMVFPFVQRPLFRALQDAMALV